MTAPRASCWVARNSGASQRRWFLVRVAAEKGFGPRTQELKDARGRLRRWGSGDAARVAAQRLNGCENIAAEVDFGEMLNRKAVGE